MQMQKALNLLYVKKYIIINVKNKRFVIKYVQNIIRLKSSVKLNIHAQLT